jgi:hypothetical protein
MSQWFFEKLPIFLGFAQVQQQLYRNLQNGVSERTLQSPSLGRRSINKILVGIKHILSGKFVGLNLVEIGCL